MRTRGSLRSWFSAVAVVTLCCGLVWVPPASASVTSDQMQIVAIQRRIAAQGAQVRSVVLREHTAGARLDALNRQIGADEQRIAADERQEDSARLTLRQVGVSAYITEDSTNSPVLDMFTESESMPALLAHHTYIRSVSDQIANALAAFNSARDATAQDDAHLHAAKHDAAHALAKLRHEQRAATAAIAAEQQTLTSVKQDLRVQLQAERETAQVAAERALARYPWPTSDGAVLPIPPPTPGSYANPLRAIRQLTPERIDMGVDYSGYGPIYAIGDGIVLTTTVPGWPGGTMIVYQLTDGPANGLVVYAAEDIAPTVHIGDTVTDNTALGLMYLGPDGIETGWADPAVIGNALAGDTHQFHGANTTAYGANYSEFLQTLGAPPGIPQSNPPTGTLPRNWPTWH
jgi:hypothetical protein